MVCDYSQFNSLLNKISYCSHCMFHCSTLKQDKCQWLSLLIYKKTHKARTVCSWFHDKTWLPHANFKMKRGQKLIHICISAHLLMLIKARYMHYIGNMLSTAGLASSFPLLLLMDVSLPYNPSVGQVDRVPNHMRRASKQHTRIPTYVSIRRHACQSMSEVRPLGVFKCKWWRRVNHKGERWI